jgi:hypothetical protein
MKSLTRATSGVLALAAAVGVSTQAWAITPFDASVDPSEDMEHDTDAYTPGGAFTFNPLGDPALAGDTPGAGPAHPGSPPATAAGQDWFDIRNGGVGVIEEVPSGHGGVLSPIGSYLGHAATPHSAGNHAIVQFEGGDGPFGRVNRHVTTKPVAGAYTGSRTGYWATSDLYINPATAYGGADGIPDFWWTNAVNRSDTGTYFTESGFTGTVDPSGLSWTITTTAGGQPSVSVPVGSWIGLEVEPKVSATIPGGVDFEHRIYADGGTHAVLIYSHTLPEYTGTVGGFGLLTGPRYNWYTFPGPNVPYVLADNVGWAAVPEPGALSVLGIGALALARRTRRGA